MKPKKILTVMRLINTIEQYPGLRAWDYVLLLGLQNEYNATQRLYELAREAKNIVPTIRPGMCLISFWGYEIVPTLSNAATNDYRASSEYWVRKKMIATQTRHLKYLL